MNEKKKKELSNKYSLTRIILFVVLIVGTLIICGFFAHLCNDNLENNEKDYFTEREYAVSILTNSVELFNNARYEYDPVYDKMAKAILADFQDDFKNAGGTADSVNLEELRQKYISRYSQDLNLYIIDSKSTILKTTEEGAEGYNFDILPEFQERLQQMRLANEMEVDPLLQSYTSKDKVQMKWAYIPSIDHKYLLEIGLLIQSPFNNQDNIYPTTGLIPENYLTSVFFFTQNALIKDDPKEGLQRLGSLSKNLTYLPERKEYLNRSFKGQESFYIDIPEQNERIYYSYIPSPVQDSPSSRYTDRVLEIAFDINPLIEQQQDSIKLYLNFTVISVFGLIIFGIIISKFVVKPVDNIINDIEIIADGDYDHEIHATHGLEFYRLELSIKKMIDSLKEELKVNQQKTVELDKELNMRLIAEKNLINAGRKLQFAEKIAHHGSFEVIKKDLTPEWSEELIKIMGHDPETFKPLPDTFFDQISPDNSEIVNSAFEKMLQDGTNTDISFWIKRPNGEGRYVRMVAEVSDLKEDGARIFGSIQDNTSYHILQQERDMAAAQVTDLYNNAPCGYYSVNSDLAIVAINDTFLNMLQYSRDEVNGGIITDFMPENYITEYKSGFEELVRTGSRLNMPGRFIRKDGTIFPVIINATAIVDENGTFINSRSTIIDNTEKERYDAEIIRSLHEKELLLNEIHHRVKNNLQVISSMLFMESRASKSSEVKTILNDCQARIKSMVLLYEQTYQGKNIGKVNLADYLDNLIIELVSTYSTKSGKIKINVNTEGITMDLDVVVPCSLVLNEMITNSLKYAFPGDRTGLISIECSENDGMYTLVYSDDGIGLPEDINPRIHGGSSLGMTLIAGFMQQLDGTVTIDRSNGTKYIMKF